jgi:endonuclease YncB( thermonuclease family)
MIPHDAPKFSIKSQNRVRVTSLHDGDTLTCVFDPFVAGEYYTLNVRIAGIDTPELKGVTREKALNARQRMFELLTLKFDVNTLQFRKKDFDVFFKDNYIETTLECQGFDKYGRLLGDIPNIRQTLIQEGHAYAYDGGTKNVE